MPKVSSLEAYNMIYKLDFIYINKTFLGSSLAMDNRGLLINGCNLIRVHYPSNSTTGGVCIPCKKKLFEASLMYLNVKIAQNLIILF